MNIIRVKNYEELSEKAADIISSRILANPQLNLGLATGGTPIQTYKNVIDAYNNQHLSFNQVTTFNLDEYIGVAKTNPNSYHYYMRDHLFQYIDIPEERSYIPNGLAENLEEECRNYEDILQKNGGIDLQLLGLGTNGHIGFNEPGTPFDKGTHVVQLAEATIQANARFFASEETVPQRAITMGIHSIMKSKEILLLVSGNSKNDALNELLHGTINTNFPASILNKHENVTIIADEDALKNISL